MRLIRITTISPLYLHQFYENYYGLKAEPYDKQYKALVADCFGWADFWTRALEKHGYEVWEPVNNAEAMQKRWAKENGFNYEEDNWLYEITTSQICNFKPDIIFTNDFRTFNSDYMKFIREECSSIRLIIGWCASPFGDHNLFDDFNLLLSSIPSYVDYFNSKGHHCEYMLHAFEPTVLKKIKANGAPSIPIAFIGSIVKKKHFHFNREAFLAEILGKINIEIWSEINKISNLDILVMIFKKKIYDIIQILKAFPSLYPILSQIPKVKSYYNLKERPQFSNVVDKLITSISNPPIFGLTMYETLHNSKMVLNVHGDNSADFASNMRLYEATGMGACLLTERQNNLKELFKPEVEVVTYQSADEAAEKIAYLLSNDKERYKIAMAGQRKTLKEHTFEKRAEQLNSLILERLKSQ